MISKIYKIGGMLGLSKDDVTYSIACHLIEIYSFFGAYNLAYDAMVVMARKNTTWVWIKEDVIRWAATQNITFKVYDAIVFSFGFLFAFCFILFLFLLLAISLCTNNNLTFCIHFLF